MGEEQEVMRINRKDGSPQMKKTWPLPWTTDGEGPSVVKVLEECGWGVRHVFGVNLCTYVDY